MAAVADFLIQAGGFGAAALALALLHGVVVLVGSRREKPLSPLLCGLAPALAWLLGWAGFGAGIRSTRELMELVALDAVEALLKASLAAARGSLVAGSLAAAGALLASLLAVAVQARAALGHRVRAAPLVLGGLCVVAAAASLGLGLSMRGEGRVVSSLPGPDPGDVGLVLAAWFLVVAVLGAPLLARLRPVEAFRQQAAGAWAASALLVVGGGFFALGQGLLGLHSAAADRWVAHAPPDQQPALVLAQVGVSLQIATVLVVGAAATGALLLLVAGVGGRSLVAWLTHRPVPALALLIAGGALGAVQVVGTAAHDDTVTAVLEASSVPRPADLDVPRSTSRVHRSERRVVVLRQDGGVAFEGAGISVAALAAALAPPTEPAPPEAVLPRRGDHGAAPQVAVLADGRAEARALVELLVALQAAGVGAVELLAWPEDYRAEALAAVEEKGVRPPEPPWVAIVVEGASPGATFAPPALAIGPARLDVLLPAPQMIPDVRRRIDADSFARRLLEVKAVTPSAARPTLVGVEPGVTVARLVRVLDLARETHDGGELFPRVALVPAADLRARLAVPVDVDPGEDATP